MIFTFKTDQESEFQECIAENQPCHHRRWPDRLEVLTGEDMPAHAAVQEGGEE